MIGVIVAVVIIMVVVVIASVGMSVIRETGCHGLGVATGMQQLKVCNSPGRSLPVLYHPVRLWTVLGNGLTVGLVQQLLIPLQFHS